MTVLRKIKSHPDVINFFKELPFCDTYIEKPKIKGLKKNWFTFWTSFYAELTLVKTDDAFKGYPMSYKVELVEKKDPSIQLEATKSSIKDLLNDLLDGTKGFKYEITIKVELK